MTMKEPIKVEIHKPHIGITSDIWGKTYVMVDGRALVQINYLAPYIDNAGVRSLAVNIAKMLGANPDDLVLKLPDQEES